jgi:hypothetical protein
MLLGGLSDPFRDREIHENTMWRGPAIGKGATSVAPHELNNDVALAAEGTKTGGIRATHFQPRSGARMQPTAQAVGNKRKSDQSSKGAEEVVLAHNDKREGCDFSRTA